MDKMFSLASLTRSCIIVFAVVSTASAINGRTAVGRCIDSTASGARCAWSVSKDGSIDVCNKSGCITCPSETGTCTAARRGRPRPTTFLPPGTELNTAVGSFTIPIAMDGRTAVGKCIDSTASGARCAWSVSEDGSIDVCDSSGCVTCPSATGTCTAARRGRPRPSAALPPGTEVKTEVGSFKIRKR